MVRARPGRLAASVDIGSYSVHLLVATVHGHGLDEVFDESAFLGLGRIIDHEGELGSGQAILIDTIQRYAARARDLGAAPVTLAGTDPLRRAPDAALAIRRIQAATGLDVATLSHEEEALIALLGVQAGRPLRRETAMVDVGGGSTEVLIAGPGREPVAAGLPLGATRLTGVHLHHDPPTEPELEALIDEVAVAMEEAPDAVPIDLLAVGGTARSLLRVGPRLANRALTRRRIRRALELIAAAPAATTSERHNIRLSRARVLAAGAAILLGALQRYRLDRLRVAKGGLREGLILAAHHGGPGWRDEIRELARGWER
jgi:exopolyphosphatase / guanosine-5'-triphosphate,3'-diphosphate pyrophosphatase